jgi:hypothetical protein
VTGVTAAGRQAYAILSWANDDPAIRTEEAVQRVTGLAREIMEHDGQGTPELREVQDVGKVLSRLAGTVRETAMAGTVSDQLDLAFDPASHPRDPATGRFIGVPGGSLAGRSAASIKAHDTASLHAKQKLAADRAAREARESGPAGDIGAITGNLRDQFGGEGTIGGQVAGMVPRSDFEKLQKQVRELQASVERDRKSAEEKIRQSSEKVEDREKANLVKEGLITLGGAALIGALTGGIGSVVALPYIIEKSPELVGLLYSHFVVSKGHGRHLVAHPAMAVKKAAVTVATHPAIAPRVAAMRSLISRGPAQPAALSNYQFAGTPGLLVDEAVAAQTAVTQLASILIGGGMPAVDAGEYARAMLREYVDTHQGELERNGVDTGKIIDALASPPDVASDMGGTISGQVWDLVGPETEPSG